MAQIQYSTRRVFAQLDAEDRLNLSYYLMENNRAKKLGEPELSLRDIGTRIGFCHTTVSRELRRNLNEHGHYVAIDA